MCIRDSSDADDQAPLYLHTTEEMLEEFEYLGSDKAHEIVIDNPNMIADWVEKIAPVRPDKCPPVIPDSDRMLREICYNRAHEMYGEDLPEVVTERLERELNSIIDVYKRQTLQCAVRDLTQSILMTCLQSLTRKMDVWKSSI